MFGDVAIQLLKLMGHSGTVPSALLADDVPSALDRLKKEIKKQEQLMLPQDSSEVSDDEPEVTLSHRALPLIELLKAAAKEECNVMWDSNK
jgi:hypothetical protein